MNAMGNDLHAKDWDWFMGRWRVHHRRLKTRLAGSSEWQEFEGSCECWSTLGGLGNVDDNLVELPGAPYRAMTLRAFDAKSGRWGIWWLDGRSAHAIEPPVHGVFENGIGRFFGDDVLNGRPIRVRFTWSHIDTTSPVWEQAFSADGGEAWETNWVMTFRRAR